MPDSHIQELWTRLETWLSTDAPHLLEILQPGATEAQIKAAEELMGVAFPDDFKACYRIHDGQNPDGTGLFFGREFLSLQRIQAEWTIWKELLDAGTFEGIPGKPRGPIRNDWWNLAWIPITSNGYGDNECLDLAPAPGGQSGQVIGIWHDDSLRELRAESYAKWLENFVLKCESKHDFDETEHDFPERDNA